MIKQITMYTVICDNCGADSNEDSDASCWSHVDFATQIAEEIGWVTDIEKHYCGDCYSYDDEGKLVLNKERAIPKI